MLAHDIEPDSRCDTATEVYRRGVRVGAVGGAVICAVVMASAVALVAVASL